MRAAEWALALPRGRLEPAGTYAVDHAMRVTECDLRFTRGELALRRTGQALPHGGRRIDRHSAARCGCSGDAWWCCVEGDASADAGRADCRTDASAPARA